MILKNFEHFWELKDIFWRLSDDLEKLKTVLRTLGQNL